MKLTVILVDDEPTARRRLKRLLLAAGDVEIVAECANGAAAVAALRQHRVDAVFLDVQMPEMSGFDVLRVVGTEHMPLVVFVTAFDEFALQAFEAHAIDYLLKPFGEDRVQRALDRVRRFMAGRPENSGQRDQLRELLQATTGPGLPSCLLVKRGDRLLLLRPADIDWIEAVGDYAKVHVGAESHLMRSTLADLQKKLAGDGFVRVHRSRLVNLARIRELRPSSRGESVVVLRTGVRLDASYTFLKEIQDRLGA